MTPVVLIATLQLGQTPTAPVVIDKAIAAHKGIKKISAKVLHENTLQGKLSTTQHDFQLVLGDGMRVRSVNVSAGLDRTFIVKGSSGFAQDNRSKEWLTKSLDPKYPLTEKFVDLAGALDEPLRYLIDSRTMVELLEVLKKTGRWNLTSSGNEFVLQSGSAATGMTLKLSKTLGYVTYLRVANQGGANSIKYAYEVAPVSITLPKTGTGTKVTTFGSAIGSPKYVNATAKTLAAKVWTRYDSIKSISYTYSSDTETINASYSRDMFKLKRGGWDWAYDGSRLTVLNHKTKQYWQMKTEKGNILFRLTKANAPTEPWIRSILASGHPLSGLYRTGLTMSAKGSFGSAGSMVDLLEISSTNGKSTLEVQRATGLINGYLSQQIDNRGRVIGSSDGSYKYHSVDKALPASDFRLPIPTGYKQGKFGD